MVPARRRAGERFGPAVEDKQRGGLGSWWRSRRSDGGLTGSPGARAAASLREKEDAKKRGEDGDLVRRSARLREI